MRVTQSMISAQLLSQINNSYKQLSITQQELSSGKKISKPSDDPVVASQGIAYRTDVAQVDQYTRNMDTANQWMTSSDSALNDSNQVLQRVRELTVQASSDTTTPSDRSKIKDEIDQLKQHLVSDANTQVAGKYIFNGTQTGTKPVVMDSQGNITFSASKKLNGGDPTNKVMIEANQGVNLQINVDPTTVFSQGLFSDLNDLEAKLTDPSATGKDITGFISKIDGHLDELSSSQSSLGARENRVQLITNRLSDQKNTAETIMSKNEDADFETTLVNFQQQQATYQAALSVGAKNMQPTLVDFLK